MEVPAWPTSRCTIAEQARRNRRTLEEEIKRILDAAAQRRERFWEEVDRIRASFGDRKFSDSAELIREDRDR